MKRGERVYGWVPLHSVDCQFAEKPVTWPQGKRVSQATKLTNSRSPSFVNPIAISRLYNTNDKSRPQAPSMPQLARGFPMTIERTGHRVFEFCNSIPAQSLSLSLSLSHCLSLSLPHCISLFCLKYLASLSCSRSIFTWDLIIKNELVLLRLEQCLCRSWLVPCIVSPILCDFSLFKQDMFFSFFSFLCVRSSSSQSRSLQQDIDHQHPHQFTRSYYVVRWRH